MDEILNIKGTGTGPGTKGGKGGKREIDTAIENQDQYRVVIDTEANRSLEAVAAKVNAGFEAGSVTRSDVANYIFLQLEKLISESDIKAIRTLHFNEKKVLASILRGQDDLPEEVKRALRAHYGILDKDKKKTAKPQAEISADINSNSL